ncbi:MAG: carbohydrate-binding protein [Planctomycetes bacterium]|nr:carbohydrate-binding protein [Planctomycetota bacterium]
MPRFSAPFALVMLAAAAIGAETPNLTVMSFNIHNSNEGVTNQAQFILAQNPDVVCLQEVNPGYPTQYQSELQRLSGRTWYPSAFLNDSFLLSRIPLIDTAATSIGGNSWGADRTAARVKILVNGVAVNIVDTHLDIGPGPDWGPGYRDTNTAQLLAWTQTLTQPQILCGDMNCWYNSTWIASIENQFTDTWQDLYGTPVGPDTMPGWRPDYVFRSIAQASLIRPVASWTVSGQPSDHQPMITSFAVGGATPPPPPPPAPAIALPARVQAEDYVRAYDTSTGNSGGQYRSGDVDIEPCSDAGGGYNVGWTAAGEWLEYDVSVATAGSFDLTARLASAVAGTKTVRVLIDGSDVSGAMSFTEASGWQAWQSVVAPGVSLSAGAHTLRIALTTGGLNVNFLDVVRAAPPAVPRIALPGRFQAEDYQRAYDTTTANEGGQYRTSEAVDIEGCSDAGGGFNVGWIRAGEWLEYDVTVASSGAYDVRARVASAVAGTKTLRVLMDGSDVTGAISFTDGSGWQSWNDAVARGVTLASGAHTLRISCDTGGFNLNWLEVVSASAPPAPSWSDADVGAVAIAGGSTVNGSGFSISASGTDLYGTADAFHYFQRQLTGDGTLIARVVSIQNTNEWAQAGIMLRQDLTAGSPHASMLVTQIDRCKFRRRTTVGGSTTSVGLSPGSGLRLPVWLKLVRTGTTVSAFRSTDGATWTAMGSDTVAMSATICAGVWASSYTNVQGGAVIDNVSLTAAAGAAAATASLIEIPTDDGDVAVAGDPASLEQGSKGGCGLGGGVAVMVCALFAFMRSRR